METAYIIRNGVIIGSGSSSSVNPDSSSTYIINCTIVSETGLEIEIANYDGVFTKIKQTIADGGKVELRTNFNSSNYILEPSRIEEDYVTFNTIDKNANITIKVTEYGINDVSYIDLNSNGGATIDDTVTSTETTWSSEKIQEEIESSAKSYFTINTLSNTKYIKIIPDNEQRHIIIVSEDGECVEIFGDNDNGDQYIEECPKVVRLSYGAIQSFNASEKTANIEKVLYNQTTGSKNFYVQCKSLLGYTIHGVNEQPQLVDGNSAEASQLLQQGLKEMPIISLIPEKDFYRVVAQDKMGYFKFKPSSDGGNEQPLRATATDNYGGMIEISGNAPSQDQYKPFKCVRLSNGTYASYDAANTTNNKMKKLYLYDGYMYLQVETYTTVTFTGLIEAPTFVETLADTSTEIPIVSLVNPSIKAAAGSNINSVGTPSVTASESNGTTTFTFNYLKGAKGDTGANGTTPTIKAAAGSNINTVGTPSVTASTSGTTTTFTFNNLKGAKGDTGAAGSNGTTPTIKVASGSNIGSVGTPSVTASTSGTTTTLTFDYLKGAKGATGATGATGASPLIHVNGMGGGEKTMAELGPGEGILAICTQVSGGSVFNDKNDSTVKCNGANFNSSFAAEAGKSYVIVNTSSTATARIYCKNNGGSRWTIVGDVI